MLAGPRVWQRNGQARVISFFFQPDDGIRYATVTGVQTCALPISNAAGAQRSTSDRRSCPCAKDTFEQGQLLRSLVERCAPAAFGMGRKTGYDRAVRDALQIRSEERRVGKEWRCRRCRTHEE